MRIDIINSEGKLIGFINKFIMDSNRIHVDRMVLFKDLSEVVTICFGDKRIKAILLEAPKMYSLDSYKIGQNVLFQRRCPCGEEPVVEHMKRCLVWIMSSFERYTISR